MYGCTTWKNSYNSRQLLPSAKSHEQDKDKFLQLKTKNYYYCHLRCVLLHILKIRDLEVILVWVSISLISYSSGFIGVRLRMAYGIIIWDVFWGKDITNDPTAEMHSALLLYKTGFIIVVFEFSYHYIGVALSGDYVTTSLICLLI